ncbi:MAG: putative ABC transporter permease [Clostridia bacterium]|nr:putative ABC transporter permease [Clostridia bacterium]
MQLFLLYLFLFLAGCVLGWVIEVFFRRFFSAKKWVNPGFMKGPWLPLYGFGVILMFTMCYLCISVFPQSVTFYNPLGDLFGRSGVSGAQIADLIPIIMMWIGMVALEFTAGLVFIKGFHVKLWDYSNMKGNVMGIICPVFTVIWLAVAVIYYYAINPFLYKLAINVYAYMFGGEGAIAHFGFIFALGLSYGLMIYDLTTSIGLFNAISKFAKDSGMVAKAEELKAEWNKLTDEGKKKMFSVLPKVVKEGLNEYKNAPKNALKDKINKVILIDPSKSDAPTDNYDESGRPVRTDEDK